MTTTRLLGGGPTREADRRYFATLTEADRNRIARAAAALYDGSRTVGACWKEAMLQHHLSEEATR